MKSSLRFFSEVVGCTPVRLRVAQAKTALLGEPDVPASRIGLSSLSQLHPRLAWPLWRGRAAIARTTVVTNLFNHTQTPIELGWSVKRTQCRDFRGRQLTYDSHNGTDFAIPVGSTLTAAAPARVAHIVSEFNRGGLKVFLDHGDGLMTSYAHLARSLVREGDTLGAGEPFALSGYSGLDGLGTFPFGVPHVHFNVWLNGAPVDPFAHDECPSMWAGASGRPLPRPQLEPDVSLPVAGFDDQATGLMIAACVTPGERARLESVEDPYRRAALTLVASNYYPTRFPVRVNPYQREHGRVARLWLPLSADEFDSVVFLDDL